MYLFVGNGYISPVFFFSLSLSLSLSLLSLILLSYLSLYLPPSLPSVAPSSPSSSSFSLRTLMNIPVILSLWPAWRAQYSLKLLPSPILSLEPVSSAFHPLTPFLPPTCHLPPSFPCHPHCLASFTI